ncbi:MAG: ATP-binding protein [Puniceicoccales bacterium]|jgi:predicted AAA+ superfamily ATPase|nr:ATP-binding protein [Puniceicoccales bacterium]
MSNSHDTTLIKRDAYLGKIRPFVGTDLVKVLTGIRRCGKSVMLKLVQEELLANGVPQSRILAMDFDSPSNYPFRDGARFYEHFKMLVEQQGAVQSGERIHLFFDEIQEVSNWEQYVNGLRMLPNTDIYVTGSNAKLFSGELATYLVGRHISFEIHPFSFAEFTTMHREFLGEKTPADVFNDYMRFGGMPFLHNMRFEYAPSMEYLRGIYHSIMLKDIVRRHNIRDVDLLERIVTFVLANIGKTFSATSISKYFRSEKRTVSTDTVLNYIKVCEDAFLFYRAKRNDLQGKRLLTVNEKYYIADHGFREALFQGSQNAPELIFENIVFTELRRRGYEVTVGKVGDLEIDFVATRQNAPVYIQVSYYCGGKDTLERELAPLKKLVSDYPKYLISMDDFDLSRDGITHLNIRNFLLSSL